MCHLGVHGKSFYVSTVYSVFWKVFKYDGKYIKVYIFSSYVTLIGRRLRPYCMMWLLCLVYLCRRLWL